MEFKAGDKIKMIMFCSGVNEGEICELHYGTHDGRDMESLWAWGKGGAECSCWTNWKKIEENTPREEVNGSMTDVLVTLTPGQKELLDADTQTLLEAGYLNSDLTLTESGRYALVSFLLTENKAAFAKQVAEEIAKIKEKNKQA